MTWNGSSLFKPLGQGQGPHITTGPCYLVDDIGTLYGSTSPREPSTLYN